MSLFKGELKVFNLELLILLNLFIGLSYFLKFGKIVALIFYMIQLMEMIQRTISLFLLSFFKSNPVPAMVRVYDHSLYHFTGSSLRGLDRCLE
jgi:hypothetical protein